MTKKNIPDRGPTGKALFHLRWKPLSHVQEI